MPVNRKQLHESLAKRAVELLEEGLTQRVVMARLGISRAQLRRAMEIHGSPGTGAQHKGLALTKAEKEAYRQAARDASYFPHWFADKRKTE